MNYPVARPQGIASSKGVVYNFKYQSTKSLQAGGMTEKHNSRGILPRTVRQDA